MNGSAASGFMTIEASDKEPDLPVTALINNYITGYLGAAAALVKRAAEGGSWHVTVNLTRTAMWRQSLGFVDPERANCDLTSVNLVRTCRTDDQVEGFA
jgi:crotonobetainyl-CoA:carnitine CoA-transferase CaiB-like acyl-CoA transferase